VFNKLSVHSKDYFAVIGNIDYNLLEDIKKSTKGIVCVGKTDFSSFEVRSVKSVKHLDDSAFDKVLMYFDSNDVVQPEELIRITDHFGMVLINDFPKVLSKSAFSRLEDLGIFEYWSLQNQSKDSFDLLFKVRKL